MGTFFMIKILQNKPPHLNLGVGVKKPKFQTMNSLPTVDRPARLPRTMQAATGLRFPANRSSSECCRFVSDETSEIQIKNPALNPVRQRR